MTRDDERETFILKGPILIRTSWIVEAVSLSEAGMADLIYNKRLHTLLTVDGEMPTGPKWASIRRLDCFRYKYRIRPQASLGPPRGQRQTRGLG